MRTLVIDLDGVLRVWDSGIISSAEDHHGLPAGSLVRAAVNADGLQHAVTGLITDEEWRVGIAEALAAEFGAAGVAAVAEWSGSVGRIDRAVLTLLRSERKRKKVALLTNATSRLTSDLDRLGVTEEFDHVFNSSDLGVAKPSAVCFEMVCESMSVGPEECLFVDDSVINVSAAAAIGMSAHHYRTVEDLASFIECEG